MPTNRTRAKVVNRVCKHCKAEFSAPLWSVNQGRSKFCTFKCHNDFKTAEHLRNFYKNTTRKGSCWIWNGLPGSDGYGKTKYMGRTARAHRVSYQIAHGPIGEGLCVCHRCDTAMCINPEHLFLGTSKENTQDASAKGRLSCGERHVFSRLTVGKVLQIRDLHKRGVGLSEIGRRFDIHHSTVWHIVNRRAWKHV